MCGRYVSPEQAAIERLWHIGRHNSNPFDRMFNVAPTTLVPMLRFDPAVKEVALTSARWGLIPHWWDKAKPPNFTFNARLEEAASKPMWRHPLRHARCLLPALGWYEWQVIERIDPATGEIKIFKQPHFIRRRDAVPFCFAGLMSLWSPPESSESQVTCAILTQAAAGPAAEVHGRMPVILPDNAHAAWLDATITEAGEIASIIQTHAVTDALEHYPVSTRVNNARSQGPELIEPLL